jgi:hypothetical protein
MAGLVAGFPLLPRGSLEGAGFLSRAGSGNSTRIFVKVGRFVSLWVS